MRYRKLCGVMNGGDKTEAKNNDNNQRQWPFVTGRGKMRPKKKKFKHLGHKMTEFKYLKVYAFPIQITFFFM